MRKRWEPTIIKVRYKEIDAREFKQRLEEIAEILYGKNRQQASKSIPSTESRLTEPKRPKVA